MKNPFTHPSRLRTLALTAVLAAVAFGSPATSAGVATPASAGTEQRPSFSAHAGQTPSAGELPTLVNDVGRPASDSQPELTVGIGLLAIGLLGLVLGVTARLAPRPVRLPRARRAPA